MQSWRFKSKFLKTAIFGVPHGRAPASHFPAEAHGACIDNLPPRFPSIHFEGILRVIKFAFRNLIPQHGYLTAPEPDNRSHIIRRLRSDSAIAPWARTNRPLHPLNNWGTIIVEKVSLRTVYVQHDCFFMHELRRLIYVFPAQRVS